MKKCTNCGKENIDKAIFCADCGARLDSTSGTSSHQKHVNTPALDSLNNHLADGSSTNPSGVTSSSNENTKKRTNEGPSKLRICCCYVPIILLIVSVAWALVYHESAESFPTSYGADFNYLDLDGDGKLSFFEASQADTEIPDSQMTKYFNEADTNGNAYLKGHEFDIFADDLIDYHNSLESPSSDSDKYKYSSSSSSSNYNSSSSSSKSHSSSSSHNHDDYDYDSDSEGYVLTCPYCGSEAIYETGGYYKCAECGSSIYSPDDLELAYQEGYMELLVPVSLLHII